MTLPLLLAQAAEQPAPPIPGLGNPLIFMALMFVLMYFLLIRPQNQRRKKQEEQQAAVAAGDHIITIGGAHGIVSSVREKTIMLKVADNVRIEFDKTAIATVTKKANDGENSASSTAS